MQDEQDRLTRRVLWSLPSGLYLIGTCAQDRVNLMTANWVSQVATTPRILAASLEVASVTLGLARAGGGFSVSILAKEDRAVIRRFVKPSTGLDADGEGGSTMAGEEVRLGTAGRPHLARAVGVLEVDLVAETAFDSHVVLFGEVTDALELRPGTPVLEMGDTRMNYGG